MKSTYVTGENLEDGTDHFLIVTKVNLKKMGIEMKYERCNMLFNNNRHKSCVKSVGR